ncbi:MAG: TonB-dependent receptor [Steroidobacteraceae bacterium]
MNVDPIPMKYTQYLLSTLTVLSVPAIQVVHAAQSEIADTLESVTITASRSGVPLSQLGGTEIDRKRIEQSLPFSIIETLNEATGVTAFDKSGAGGSSYISIRGGEPNYTLVMLDGAKVNDPTNSQGGAFDLAQLDPAVLQKVEIYRGALSAVHGADALSGVINLQLRSLAEGEMLRSATLQADSKQGAAINGTFGAGWNSGNVLLSAGWADSGELSGLSTRERKQVLGRVSQDVGLVRLAGMALRSDTEREAFPEDSGGERLAVNRKLENSDGQLQLAKLDLSAANAEVIRPHLSASWSRQTADTQTPAIFPGVYSYVPPINADTDFRRREIVADVAVAINSQLTAVVGAGHIKEEGSSQGNVNYGILIPANFDIERATHSAFAELTFKPVQQLSLTGGARYDDPSQQEASWTGRLSARYQPASTWPAIYANVSNGYKLPSLYALAYPLIANPTLKPERSRAYEAGVQHDTGDVHYRLGYFRTRFTDMIDFDPALFTNVNRSWVVTQGVEGDVSQVLTEQWSWSANLTYMDASAIGDAVLRSRPRLQGRATIDWQFASQWRAWTALRYTSEFYDSSVPTGVIKTEPATTVDVGADYRLGSHLRFATVLKNVLDEHYEDSVGTAAPGRLVRVSITASF